MSPNDKAVIISDYFAEDEYQQALLMTAICNGLTNEKIDKLYKCINEETKKTTPNKDW